jgi:hypothetical protein
MFISLAADESGQILLFVCLPLFALLIILIVLIVRGSHRTAVFADFSVTVTRVGREETYVSYACMGKQVEFEAEVRRTKSSIVPLIRLKIPGEKLLVRLPQEMSMQDLRSVVSHLACALTKLHYRFLIYRRRDLVPLSAEDRAVAITELRKMGVELDVVQEQLASAKILDWQKTVGTQANVVQPQIQGLLRKARGISEDIEVLADSDVRA